jgi:hypothetical protein
MVLWPLTLEQRVDVPPPPPSGQANTTLLHKGMLGSASSPIPTLLEKIFHTFFAESQPTTAVVPASLI